MDIQNIQFQLRRRRLDEIFDFAFYIFRENLGRYIKLLGVPAIFFVAFNIAIIFLMNAMNSAEDEFSVFSPEHVGMVLLLFAQRSLYSLLMTAYNGYLLFDEKPSLKQVWKDVWKIAPLYFWHQVILRSIYLFIGGGTLLLPWRSAVVHFFKSEVMVLEKLTGKNMRQRLAAISRGQGDRTLLFLFFDSFLFLFYIVVIVFAYNSVIELLVLHELFWWLDASFSNMLLSPPIQFLILPYLIFHSQAKFVFYIDARSLREGWDVELNLIRGAHDTLGGPLEEPGV